MLIITQKILNVNSFERFFEQMFVLFQIETVYRYMNEKKAPGWVLSVWMIFYFGLPIGSGYPMEFGFLISEHVTVPCLSRRFRQHREPSPVLPGSMP